MVSVDYYSDKELQYTSRLLGDLSITKGIETLVMAVKVEKAKTTKPLMLLGFPFFFSFERIQDYDN
jgi:hypothetical protein